MAVLQPFNPQYTKSVSLTVSAASSSATVPTGTKSLILTNIGANPAFVRVGPAGITASSTSPTADFPVPSNSQVTITRFQDDTTIAAIGTGSTLWVTPGEGW